MNIKGCKYSQFCEKDWPVLQRHNARGGPEHVSHSNISLTSADILVFLDMFSLPDLRFNQFQKIILSGETRCSTPKYPQLRSPALVDMGSVLAERVRVRSPCPRNTSTHHGAKRPHPYLFFKLRLKEQIDSKSLRTSRQSVSVRADRLCWMRTG